MRIEERCGCIWWRNPYDELDQKMLKCCNRIESHKILWNLQELMEKQKKKKMIIFTTPRGNIETKTGI